MAQLPGSGQYRLDFGPFCACSPNFFRNSAVLWSCLRIASRCVRWGFLRAGREERVEGRMPNPAPVLVRLLAMFAPAFTAPTFAHALTLAYGAILAPGQRTVAAALRAVGLNDERHFTTYHRVLNRAAWSPLTLSRILLGLIVAA